jgi:hypothetical protein
MIKHIEKRFTEFEPTQNGMKFNQFFLKIFLAVMQIALFGQCLACLDIPVLLKSWQKHYKGISFLQFSHAHSEI